MQRMKLVGPLLLLMISCTACQAQVEDSLGPSAPSPFNSPQASSETSTTAPTGISPVTAAPNSPDSSPDHGDAKDLPSQLKLPFVFASMSGLVMEKPAVALTRVKSIPFGVAGGQQVSLELYQEEAMKADNHGSQKGIAAWLHTGAEWLRIPEQLSSDVLTSGSQDGTSTSVWRPPSDWPGAKQSDHLLGSVELFADGPGLRAYVMYNDKTRSWACWEAWGNPSVVDTEGDGGAEIMVQFTGQHLQYPDVTIIRSQSGQLEQVSVKRAIFAENVKKTYAILKPNHQIEVGFVNVTEPLARYTVQKDSLIRVS